MLFDTALTGCTLGAWKWRRTAILSDERDPHLPVLLFIFVERWKDSAGTKNGVAFSLSSFVASGVFWVLFLFYSPSCVSCAFSVNMTIFFYHGCFGRFLWSCHQHPILLLGPLSWVWDGFGRKEASPSCVRCRCQSDTAAYTTTSGHLSLLDLALDWRGQHPLYV